MEEKKYYIYKHTNLINGKIYIGQTSQDPKKRWGNGISTYQHNEHFLNAIKKYGWENFSHEILLSNLSKDEMKYWEKYYIKYYDTQNPEKGYNIIEGGLESPFEELWKKESFRQKMSQQQSDLMKKRLENPEIKEKMRQSVKQYWEEHSEKKIELAERSRNMLKEKWKDSEYRDARSTQMKELWQSEHREKLIEQTKINARKNWDNPEYRKKICKPVQCIETGDIFEAASAAERWCKVSRGVVTRAVRQNRQGGKHPTEGFPLHWRYANSTGGDE